MLKLNWNREISSSCSVFQENLRKSEQISWKSVKITTTFEKIELNKLLAFLILKTPKKIDENLLKYWGLIGAKTCKSCRSRQELSNEYFLAKFGVDTEENEPLKFGHLAEKSEKGSISNLSTEVKTLSHLLSSRISWMQRYLHVCLF